MLFMGIDVGTQGVRCIVVDEHGAPAAAHSEQFKALNIAREAGRYEQNPGDWLAATRNCIRACTSELSNPEEISTISIDGTSGTILALDENNVPLTNGIMYNDPRAREEAGLVHGAMGALERKLGYRFGASFSLPRILWIKRNLPEIYEKTKLFAHQADYVAGMLSGVYNVSDYSNALKTGYDLLEKRWPEETEQSLGIERSKLPKIIAPGEAYANVSPAAAKELGLPRCAALRHRSPKGCVVRWKMLRLQPSK